MKIKSRPDDFQVEELADYVLDPQGQHAFYQLRKRSLGTPEALQHLCKAWRIDSNRLRYGGLKDKHAETLQYLSIEGGPPRQFRDEHVQVKYLGQVAEPFGPQSFHGNRFIITMRDLDALSHVAVLRELEAIRNQPIPNYFDDQRFGSVATSQDNSQQYVARALIDGDNEQALKLALCSYYEHDRSQEKKSKQLLRQHWGQWSKIANRMPDNHLSRICHHLYHKPDDYRSAFTYIPFFLRNMYLSAYQSHLWNGILAEWIKTTLPITQLVTLEQKRQTLPAGTALTTEQCQACQALDIPLPSSRATMPTDPVLKQCLETVLAGEKLALEDIKLKQFKEPFFSKGDRQAFYTPANLTHESGWDKMHKSHRKLKLSFELPRGAYATILIKRISTAQPWPTSSFVPESSSSHPSPLTQ